MTNVLVTGGQSPLAVLVAGVLAQQPGITVHHDPPAKAVHDVVAFATWLTQHDVATVVHLDLRGEELAPGDGPGNVARAVVLLGACARARVRRVVIRSSTALYATTVDAPRIASEADAQALEPQGLAAEVVEIERLAALIATRNPAMQLVVLRLALLAGDGCLPPLLATLARRPTPVLFGYAPRLQLLHPDDAAVACALAALRPDAAGTYNIASNGVVVAGQAARLLGGVPLPVPDIGVAPLQAVARRIGRTLPGASLLRTAPVADTSRAQRELGWQPQHEALTIVQSVATSKGA